MGTDVFVHERALNESGQVGSGTRIWAFAHVMKGAVVGRDCNIGDHAFLESGAVVGDGVTIKNGVCVWDGVTLEKHVFVGPQVAFTNDRHPRSPRAPVASERYAEKGWLSRTLVREGAAIGANATILCGLTIGHYASIAAGAVVTRDVGDFELVAGCPARRMGFVCRCGQSLQEGSAPTCAACGRGYRMAGERLVAT